MSSRVQSGINCHIIIINFIAVKVKAFVNRCHHASIKEKFIESHCIEKQQLQKDKYFFNYLMCDCTHKPI